MKLIIKINRIIIGVYLKVYKIFLNYHFENEFIVFINNQPDKQNKVIDIVKCIESISFIDKPTVEITCYPKSFYDIAKFN